MIEVNLPTRSIEDRLKFIKWLSIAAASDSEAFIECTPIIKRLQREIVYYKQREKFKDQERIEREKEPKDELSEEEQKSINEWWEEKCSKDAADWEQAVQTRNEIIELKDKNLIAALDYMKTHEINDEALAYGKDKTYGGTVIKMYLNQILDMLIHFIHIKAHDAPSHEFYNDYIDDWYFKCESKGDFESKEAKELMFKNYFFPSEVFIIKIKDYYFFYSETNGQGTAFDASLYNEEKLIEFGKKYGCTLDEVKKKAFNFDDYI